ncbi:hypothetical protein HPB52_013868 [Rhipicephalus sanguineus]|uniref:Uncharacterized protein n=1 Tax=Rhipicephalus sanguineus TaxID=34632 RepID=A0A9D4PCF8_RHISA|nr:hypothetical protein HPB52_013868 [Rhipicephalus sanguineus]
MGVELSAIVLMFALLRRRKCAVGVLSTTLRKITNASRNVPCIVSKYPSWCGKEDGVESAPRNTFGPRRAPTTWAERAKPRPAQQPAQVTHAALPEQKEDPRIAFLLQENASLKAQLQQMRVEFEALKNSAQAPVRPSSAEPRPAKRRIGTEGEVAAASDSAVLGAIRDLQKSLARQAECFDLVACKVAMIESRLGLGENSFVPVTPVSLVSPACPGMPMAQAPVTKDVPANAPVLPFHFPKLFQVPQQSVKRSEPLIIPFTHSLISIAAFGPEAASRYCVETVLRTGPTQ